MKITWIYWQGYIEELFNNSHLFQIVLQLSMLKYNAHNKTHTLYWSTISSEIKNNKIGWNVFLQLE